MMGKASIKTGVDSLVSYLSDSGKVSLKKAASDLSFSEELLQSWVDFLLEDGIVGVEYKFTTPYIFLKNNESSDDLVSSKESTLMNIKKRFIKGLHTKDSSLSSEELESRWNDYLLKSLDKKKSFFMSVAKKKRISNPEIAFKKYTHLLQEASKA